MKEMNLKLNKKMIEIDETINVSEALREEDERFNQPLNVTTHYLDDNTNLWTEMPIFSIISWGDNYEIVHHYSDIEVFNDIYHVLTKNNLIESVE